MNGPTTMRGRMAKVVEMANTVAEPVVLVSHQMRANCITSLPIQEAICPVQMVKKGRKD